MHEKVIHLKHESYSISIIRIISMIMIFLCHIVQEHSNSIIIQTAQIFNVGVFVFLFISGFLYGNRDTKNPIVWYKKRAIRILIPLYTFFLILFIIDIATDTLTFNAKYIFIYLFNLQGLLGSIKGSAHLWFLTAIMFCYIITPILNKYKNKFTSKNSLLILIITLINIQIISTYFINGKLGLYLVYVYTYMLGYFISYLWKRTITINQSIIFTIATFGALILRFASKFIFDGTILYDNVIVLYEQAIFGSWIFFIIYLLINLVHKNKDVLTIGKLGKHLDNISFYFYITHYMFIVGPISLITLTRSFILNSIIILLISYIFAFLLMKLCNKVQSLLNIN